MKSYDVAVIGGGIVGMTAAFFLSKNGKKVAVIEKNKIADGTTANSFAWINASSKAAKGEYMHLNARGLSGYTQLAQMFGEHPLGLNPCGQIWIAPKNDKVRYDELKKRFLLLQQEEYPVTWVKSKDLQILEPSINYMGEYEGLLSFSEMCLDAPRFVHFLSQQLEDAGSSVVENNEVLSLASDDSGNVTGLLTANGEIKATQVLLAGGPNTPELLASLTGFAGFANRFPVRKSPGILITTPPLGTKRLTRRVIYWEQSPDLHALPHFSGGWRIGSDDMDGVIAEEDTPTNRKFAANCLLKRAREFLVGIPDDLTVEDCKITVGIRPVPDDGQSIADIFPGTENFFLLVTHSGVTLAPALGELMAEFICTGERPNELETFSLKRFPGFS